MLFFQLFRERCDLSERNKTGVIDINPARVISLQPLTLTMDLSTLREHVW